MGGVRCRAPRRHDDAQRVGRAGSLSRRTLAAAGRAGYAVIMEIPRRPDSAYRDELALLRARHKTIGPEWSFDDVRVLLDVAGRVEPGLADWIEEIALRIERELAAGG